MLPDVDLTGAKNIDVYDGLGHMDTFPVVRCYLRYAYYNGYVDAIRAHIFFFSILVGNIPGARDYINHNNQYVTVNAVVAHDTWHHSPCHSQEWQQLLAALRAAF